VWASSIPAAQGESNAGLRFQLACTKSASFALFTAAPQLSLAGNLTFTPAPNAHGSAVCTVNLVTSDGLESTPMQLTINITPGESMQLEAILVARCLPPLSLAGTTL
jgi:hypothetical protein